MYGSDVSPAQSAAHQQARVSRADERRVGSRRPVPPAEEGAQAPHRPPAVQTPESLTGERFPRRVRLARGPELAACWEQGRRLRTPHLDLAWRLSPLGHPRMAIVVPRFQLAELPRAAVLDRLKAAFEFLEGAARSGRIGVYGTATWTAYRQPPEAQDA